MDPQRKAPRWDRRLHFEADGSFRGDVVDLSAVGMRVRVHANGLAPSDAVLPGTLTLENGAHIRLKVRVARSEDIGEFAELGLEIAEADKAFFDALPSLVQ